MASNYTNDFQLCQWEADDKVLRDDFNADNAKIEAALKQISQELVSMREQLDKVYTADKPQVVAGMYIGDDRATRTIELGFRPRAVFLTRADFVISVDGTVHGTKYYSGLSVLEEAANGGSERIILTCVKNGFQVYNNTNVRTNESPRHFHYIAVG